MTSSSAVRVEGLARFARDLKRMGEDVSEVKDANAKVAAFVAAGSAGEAPRVSGRLAASGRGNRAVGRATVTFGGAAVPYAGPIHWGWPARGIEAHPFVSDYATRTESQWLPLYEQDIAQAVDRVAGRVY